MKQNNSWLLAGKTLKEINFPKDWIYEPSMSSWHSEKYKVKKTFMFSSYPTDKKKGEVTEEYIYIDDLDLL